MSKKELKTIEEKIKGLIIKLDYINLVGDEHEKQIIELLKRKKELLKND